jgi:HNH endonuclease
MCVRIAPSAPIPSGLLASRLGSLVLEVDHINGDPTDNRRENLRFLCPNCHSQTETLVGRNCGRTVMGNGVTGNTPGSEPGDGQRSSWFESRFPSFAAAHGCGPALVQRVIRVGTGWRLHALVAQSGRGASMRCWRLRVRLPPSVRCPSDRRPVAPCKGSPPSSTLGKGSDGRLLCRQGHRGFEPCEDAGSIPARPARALRTGVHVSLVWTRRPAQHRGGALCERTSMAELLLP